MLRSALVAGIVPASRSGGARRDGRVVPAPGQRTPPPTLAGGHPDGCGIRLAHGVLVAAHGRRRLYSGGPARPLRRPRLVQETTNLPDVRASPASSQRLL